jgi:hypothetical protein
VYQRALALIAALLAAHCAWSAMGAEDISAPNAVLAKIAAIAPARLVGLRLALQGYAPPPGGSFTANQLFVFH